MKDEREKQFKMPGVELDSSSQLDEILSELLNDTTSSSKESKRWAKDDLGNGIFGQESGSITTQSGNSRTIISWQTNQSGPKKLVTTTKQLTGCSNWNGEMDNLIAKSEEARNWKTSGKCLSEAQSAYEYQKDEGRSGTLKHKNVVNSIASSSMWKEDSSSTLGKTAKTPPPPPVRKRLTSVDELRMELLGSSMEGRAESKGDGKERNYLTRNCSSDTEETRSWLDEQIWKLQAKKSGKSYEQHTRLEKQLIADLKNRLGLAGKTTDQSDIEDGYVTISTQSKASPPPPPPPQRTKYGQAQIFSASHDDVTASKMTSNAVRNIVISSTQSDTDDSLLGSPPKDRTLTRPPSGGTQTLNSSSLRAFQTTASDDDVPRDISIQSTLRKEPVRSLSLGDDPARPTYKAKASFYVSGIERPAFSTHQTKYTFSVNPLLADDFQSNSKLPPVPPPRSSAPTSPVAPKRTDSSREAVLKSQRKLVCSPTLDELENSLRLILEQPPPQTQSSAPEKDVVDQTKVTSPVREVDDEVIVLKPIGPGIQTLEPDNIGTLKRPMTPLIPISVSGYADQTLKKDSVSPAWASAENMNSHPGQFNQQGQVRVQYSSETIKKAQLPNTAATYVAQPLANSDTNMVITQQQPWQQQHIVQQQQSVQYQQQQHPYQQQQPWQQQFLQQPLSTQQHVSRQPQPLVHSWQQQTQPQQQQQHQQQSWQQQTWQQQQQPTHQPLHQPQVQQTYIPNSMPFNQSPGNMEVKAQTTEFTQQRGFYQQPASNITQHGLQQPLSVGALNNQQGNNLHQNQEIFVHQDIHQLNAQQLNLQQQQQHLKSQQFGVHQFSPQTMNAQQMGGQNHFYGQNIGGQQMNQTNCQLMERQMVNVQPVNNQLMRGQTLQHPNPQQADVYQSTPQFMVRQGDTSTGMQQENSKFVTVEYNTSTLSPNGTLQQNGFNPEINTDHIPQQMQLTNAQNQGQLMQQQLQFQQNQLQQMQQQQGQQQQTYSRVFQESAAEQVQSGRQGAGSSMTLNNRTKSPVPLGSPTSVGSWPSVGYNDTLRSQTLQIKKTATSPQSISYETLLRTRSPSLMRAASPASIYNGQFRNGSLSSLTDGMEFANTMPRFVRDTSKYWHKPNISREDAINMLKDKPPGSFVVRNSTTFQGGFGLALKVAQLPPNVQAKGDDLQANLVRHFLIESSSKGVRLKGCSNEPVFGSLAALIYQHSITPLALPCKLLLPTADAFDETDKSDSNMIQSSACNTLYIESIDTESLTGLEALSKAIAVVFASESATPKATPVQFKVSHEGITLTDSKHRLFFRRHYPLNTVSFCGMDGNDRRLTINNEGNVAVVGKLFGFVARKSGGSSNNACHLFLNPENNQSANSIVDLVTTVMMGQGQFMKI